MNMMLRNLYSKYSPNVGKDNEKSRIMWVESTLKNIPAGKRILDAGAGEQQYRRFCSHLVYVSQDFAQYDGTGDGIGLQTGTWDQSKLDIISDICNIPEPDSSFDAIMCTEVFEHLPDPLAAIKEFSRLLKSGGYLILTAPFCSLTHFAPYHYYTGFNRYFYEKNLPDNAFTLVEISQNGNYFEYIAQEITRLHSISLKYAKKKPSILDLVSMFGVLRLCNKCSQADMGSNELLCYGYHILARKN